MSRRTAAPTATAAAGTRPGPGVLRHAGAVAAGLVVLAGAAACTTVDVGQRTTSERDVEDVTSVRLETSGRLVVERGDEPSLLVTAGDLVIDRLTSDVVGDTLVLGTDRPVPGPLGAVEYRLTVTALTEVDVRGSGDVEGHGVTGDELAVRVAGSGDVDLSELEAEAVSVLVEGSGDVRLAGRAQRQALTVDGSGEVLADDLDSDEADVTVRGSGDVEVHVTGDLRVLVEGSGSVTHTGDADVVSDVRGSGDVRGR